MDDKQPDPEPIKPEKEEASLGDDGEPNEMTAELVAYLDGELDREGNERIGAQISLDAGVRSEAESLKRTWDLLDHLPRPEPSSNFTERTVSRIEPVQPLGSASGPTGTKTGSVIGSFPTLAVPPRRRRFAKPVFVLLWLLAFLGAGIAGYFGRIKAVASLHRIDQTEQDSQILAERRLLLNMSRYRYVDDLKFLEELDNPDLFGEETPVPLNEGAK